MKRLLPAIGLLLILPVSGAGLRLLSTDDQQTDVTLNIYNNFALVREHRQMVLPRGEFELEYQDVAKTIDTASVAARSISAQSSLKILEQTYRYDLLSKHALLERFIGRRLKYSRSIREGTGFEKVLREGTLLSINPEVVRFGDVIEIEPEGIISLPYVPEDMKSIPTLLWQVENQKAGEQTLETAYLADGISWQVNYVLTLGIEPQLSAWATVSNRSGVSYKNTNLVLVAGNVHREVIRQPVERQRMMAKQAMMMESADAITQGKSLFEYHRYDLPRATTLENNVSKQIKFLDARRIRVEKTFYSSSQVMQYQAAVRQKDHADVHLAFVNDRRNNLKLPLPAGKIQVYQADSNQDLQFIGEDRLPHTPVNSTNEITVGKAFEIAIDRMQLSYRRLNDRTVEVTNQVKVKNSKDDAIELIVQERLQGEWQITQQSIKGQKINSTTQQFLMDVPKQSEQILTYTARIGR